VNYHFYGKVHIYEIRNKIGESLSGIIRIKGKPRTIKPETRLKLSSISRGVTIEVYDKSDKLVNKFPTTISVAKYFGVSVSVSDRTTRRYLENNKSYNGYTSKPNYKDSL
jgi:hypothetical protein